MNLLPRLQFPTWIGAIFILVFFSSCEEDLTTIGQGVLGEQAFSSGSEVFEVFAYNKNINAVQTNKSTVYQLGNFNDPIYGKTEAQITTQIQLVAGDPTFGAVSQAEENSTNVDDNEKVKEVYLYIPYLTSTTTLDTDRDGVIDLFDDDDENDNDNDGDGRSNLEEAAAGTDPLNPNSVDVNLDGFLDPANTELIVKDNFANRFVLDSIYGNKTEPFTLNVKRSTFFLRDSDPQTNLTEAQEYYSNVDYSSFATESLASASVLVSDLEWLIPQEDDESTSDVDESKVNIKLAPGIRIPLDNSFFQENVLDKEGSLELLTQGNFKEFIRGLHLSLDTTDDIMVLLDLSKANITMSYEYDVYTNGTVNEEKETKDYTFSLLGSSFTGNAVNTFVNENYPTEITDAFASMDPAEKIYIKGGAGTYATLNLFGNDEATSTAILEQIRSNNWIINEANLVFHVAESATEKDTNTKPPRLYLFNTETNQGVIDTANEFSANSSAFGTFLNYDGFLKESTSGDTYTIRITDHINDMVLRDSTNTTLGLTITPNINIASATTAIINNEEQEFPTAPIISPLGTVLIANDPTSEDLNLKLEIFYTAVD